jgi:hypothetical protein
VPARQIELLKLGEHGVIVLRFPEEDDGLNVGDRPIGGEIPRLAQPVEFGENVGRFLTLSLANDMLGFTDFDGWRMLGRTVGILVLLPKFRDDVSQSFEQLRRSGYETSVCGAGFATLTIDFRDLTSFCPHLHRYVVRFALRFPGTRSVLTHDSPPGSAWRQYSCAVCLKLA